jgi:hypothetical protein
MEFCGKFREEFYPNPIENVRNEQHYLLPLVKYVVL